MDDDCDSTTPDGFHELAACDSNDTNICFDDYYVCFGGGILECVDNTTVPDSAYVEVCNLMDDDCDGFTDEDAGSFFYVDSDGDNFGDSSTGVLSCIPISGRVTVSGDCDDTRVTRRPGLPEICDGLDNGKLVGF